MKNNILSAVILLAPLVFSFAFAMDVYVPAIPEMREVFHTTQAMVQVTLSIFMFTIALGQLFIGPASDQYGRRIFVYLSVILFILGSLLCAVATSIDMLISARVITAIGGCGMMVISFAMVRDVFSGDESAKVYSFLNCGVAMSPLFAPIIGSYLDSWFGWRAVFIFLTFLGLLILVQVFLFFPETLLKEKRVKVDRAIFSRYLTILTNADFISYTICSTAGLIFFFTFFSASPYILINLLQVPVKNFGYCFFIVGFSFFLGSLISGKIIDYIGSSHTVLSGALLLFAAGIAMLAWYQLFGLSLLGFIVPCMIASIGGAFLLGAGAAGAMHPFSTTAGSAAATLGCIQFLFAAIIGSIVMRWPVTSTIPLAFTAILFSAFALIALWITKIRSNY